MQEPRDSNGGPGSAFAGGRGGEGMKSGGYRYRVGSATAVTTNSTAVAAGSYASVLMTEGAGAEFYTAGSPAPVFYA